MKILHYLVEGLVIILLVICGLLALWAVLQGHQEMTRKCLERGCGELWCNYSETPVCL